VTDLDETGPDTSTGAHHSIPEVPAWLDLDALVPAEVRDEIAALIVTGEELLPAASALFAAMTEMEMRVDRLLRDVPSGLHEYLLDVTRMEELADLRLFFTALAESESDSSPTNSYLERKLKPRYGPLCDVEAPTGTVDTF
jgi:hypothetical protein